MTTTTQSQFTFFWGGFMSQWALSPFVIDGVRYNCCEQYMMAQKAKLFHDGPAYHEIMKSENPARQKRLGRLVKNFNKDLWESVARDVVYRANYAKFTQDIRMYNDLMATGDTEIVEASAEDTIWGIGLAEYDSRSRDKSQWLGTNWLGIAIQEVRERLREEKRTNNFEGLNLI